MAPQEHVLPRFAAEPPHDALPTGEWAQALQGEFLAACLRIDRDGEELGDVGEITWFPDRTWHGRTFIAATAPTANGYEVFGYVSYVAGVDGDAPTDFHAFADFTSETAAANPDWQIDLCEEVVGAWRGDQGTAAMTLVWGRPLVDGASVAVAQLGDTTVDQCPVVEGRFALLAPDDYDGATLTVKAFDGADRELARESLYADEEA